MNNAISRTSPGGEAFAATYLHYKANKSAIPLAGTFELTPRCNFSCRMCYVHENIDPSHELSAREWIDLGRTARDAGMLFLLLTGGEPFLRKDFAEIYTQLRRMGLMLSINTNGSLLTDELLSVLQDNSPARINVSLYGGSSDSYLSLCRNDAFAAVKRNILRMKDAGLAVKLNCSVTPYNAQDIPFVYEFAKENDLPIQCTTYMYPPVRINGGLHGEAPARFTAEDAAKYMLLCREQFMTPEQLAMSACHPPHRECTDETGDPTACRAGRTTFWVTWDGHMMPCGTFPCDGRYDLRTMEFGEAWDHIRSDVAALRMPKECSVCGMKGQCVICAASCIAETGDTAVKPEYICRFTHQLQELTAKKYQNGRTDQ